MRNWSRPAPLSHLEPMDAFWGQRYATVLDPDGNSVDLFAELSTKHAVSHEKTLRRGRARL